MIPQSPTRVDIRSYIVCVAIAALPQVMIVVHFLFLAPDARNSTVYRGVVMLTFTRHPRVAAWPPRCRTRCHRRHTPPHAYRSMNRFAASASSRVG